MDASFGSSTGKRHVEVALPLSLGATVAAAALFVHLPDFFRTIVSANEGLYAVVARELLHGHLPYVTAWEAKPPLFFALLAAFMAITGTSFVALHLASLIAGLFTAYAVYRIGRAFGAGGERIGVFAALLTIALGASNKGTSAEAEVFVNAFASGAFAIVAAAISTRTLCIRNAVLTGLLAGCAIEMKLTAVPLAIAAAAFAVAASPAPAMGALAVVCGLLAPVAVSILPYVAIGRTDAFLDANAGTVLRRFLAPVAHPHLYETVRWEVEALFPVWALAALTLRRWSETERAVGLMLIAWLGAAIVSLIAVREYFGYHFIMLVPPACLLAAWGFYRTWNGPAAQRIALAIAVLAVIGHGIGRYSVLAQPDPEAQSAKILRHLIAQQPGSLYVAQGDPALYVLTGETIPTRFPYPQHLYSRDMQAAANIDGTREVTRIMSTRPRYVVLRPGRENPQNAALHAADRILDRNYALRASAGEYRIYALDSR